MRIADRPGAERAVFWILCALAAQLSACSDATVSGADVAADTAALDAGVEGAEPPIREIALVIDGSDGLSDCVTRSTIGWQEVDVGYGSYSLPALINLEGRCTAALKTFKRQRDGLVAAIRDYVPADGTVALSVVLSTQRPDWPQDESAPQYEGPLVLVPYTRIDAQTKNVVMATLSGAAIPTGQIAETYPLNGFQVYGCPEAQASGNAADCPLPPAHSRVGTINAPQASRGLERRRTASSAKYYL